MPGYDTQLKSINDNETEDVQLNTRHKDKGQRTPVTPKIMMPVKAGVIVLFL